MQQYRYIIIIVASIGYIVIINRFIIIIGAARKIWIKYIRLNHFVAFLLFKSNIPINDIGQIGF